MWFKPITDKAQEAKVVSLGAMTFNDAMRIVSNTELALAA
jgi:hypothetical protein